jgi:hypothetical protein
MTKNKQGLVPFKALALYFTAQAAITKIATGNVN